MIRRGWAMEFFFKKKIIQQKDNKIVCSANCKKIKSLVTNWQKNGAI